MTEPIKQPEPNETPKVPVADAEEPIVDAELVDEPDAANLPALVDGEIEAKPDDVSRDLDPRILEMIPVDDEWADVDTGDLAPRARRIPYMSLNRNLEGGFTDPETLTVSRELDFVWLAKGRSRTWFDKPFKANERQRPACYSGDGLRAAPTSPALHPDWPDFSVDAKTGEKIVPTGNCADCPLASYDNEVRGGTKDKEVKRCREAVEALVSIRIPDEPQAVRLVRLRFNGIALAPALSFWDSFFTRLPTKPPIAYVSHATLIETDTDFGKKLAPEFTRVGQIPRRAAEPLIRERDERVKAWLEDIADDVREGVDVDRDDEQPTPNPGNRPDYENEEPF